MHEERRRTRRFTIKLPCLICLLEYDSAEEEDLFQVETRNISIGGAHFTTTTTLFPGTRMDIDILVRSPGGTEAGTTGSCINIGGEVVRIDGTGVAVKFDDQYKIFRITRRLAHHRAKIRWMEALSLLYATTDVPSRRRKAQDHRDTANHPFWPKVESNPGTCRPGHLDIT